MQTPVSRTEVAAPWDDSCPFRSPELEPCSAGLGRPLPGSEQTPCATEQHDRCPLYLVKMLRASRAVFAAGHREMDMK